MSCLHDDMNTNSLCFLVILVRTRSSSGDPVSFSPFKLGENQRLE